jgi:hypothetical protein
LPEKRPLRQHDPQKPAPHLMRGGYRFSEKIMLKQDQSGMTESHPALSGRFVFNRVGARQA